MTPPPRRSREGLDSAPIPLPEKKSAVRKAPARADRPFKGIALVLASTIFLGISGRDGDRRSKPDGSTTWSIGSGSLFSPEPQGYGHAVWCAREFVAGAPFSCSWGSPLYFERDDARREATDRPGCGRKLFGLGSAGRPAST